jgi:hypothetical protein
MITIPPLHGTKTHPLSDHARGILAQLKRGPIPQYQINPGVINRLRREALVTIDEARLVVITDKGAAEVAERGKE